MMVFKFNMGNLYIDISLFLEVPSLGLLVLLQKFIYNLCNNFIYCPNLLNLVNFRLCIGISTPRNTFVADYNKFNYTNNNPITRMCKIVNEYYIDVNN